MGLPAAGNLSGEGAVIQRGMMDLLPLDTQDGQRSHPGWEWLRRPLPGGQTSKKTVSSAPPWRRMSKV